MSYKGIATVSHFRLVLNFIAIYKPCKFCQIRGKLLIICDEPVKADKTEEHPETEDVSNEDDSRDTSPSPDLLTVSRRVSIIFF